MKRYSMSFADSLTHTPRRAVRTAEAAAYIGVSTSLMRKFRLRGPDGPLGTGPDYIRLSPSLIVYELAALDRWLDEKRGSQ